MHIQASGQRRSLAFLKISQLYPSTFPLVMRYYPALFPIMYPPLCCSFPSCMSVISAAIQLSTISPYTSVHRAVVSYHRRPYSTTSGTAKNKAVASLSSNQLDDCWLIILSFSFGSAFPMLKHNMKRRSQCCMFPLGVLCEIQQRSHARLTCSPHRYIPR